MENRDNMKPERCAPAVGYYFYCRWNEGENDWGIPPRRVSIHFLRKRRMWTRMEIVSCVQECVPELNEGSVKCRELVHACASERDVGDVITKKQCSVKEIFECWAPAAGLWSQTENGGRRRRGSSGNILWRDPLLNSLYHLDPKDEFPLWGSKLTTDKFINTQC